MFNANVDFTAADLKRKIALLRRLAADQRGTPEAETAERVARQLEAKIAEMGGQSDPPRAAPRRPARRTPRARWPHEEPRMSDYPDENRCFKRVVEHLKKHDLASSNAGRAMHLMAAAEELYSGKNSWTLYYRRDTSKPARDMLDFRFNELEDVIRRLATCP